MIFINALLVFLITNSYSINIIFKFKIPIIFVIIIFIIINIFPTIKEKKLKTRRLSNIRKGYRLLEIFLISNVLSVIFAVIQFYYYHIDYRLFLTNTSYLVLLEVIIFWNGIIRLYICSIQLGIRYRVIGILVGMIPILNLIALIEMIIITKEEVKFENEKIILNEQRHEKQICKTKYPILLVHGIFFRDIKFWDYWGRIPKELKTNGATLYYGNHSSAASIAESANELSKRIKSIIEETGCEKVNIIAHSKGGLDCRYAISECGIEQYVASLTMINTPNRGCEFVDYLLTKFPEKFVDSVAKKYDSTLRLFGDKNSDFKTAVNDLTSAACKELNSKLKTSENVYYQSFGSKLIKSNSARFPLNITTNLVKIFDGDNDGLVGEKSFKFGDNYEFIVPTTKRGISHGDVIDLNRENIKGFDVREFFVTIVSGLKDKGF